MPEPTAVLHDNLPVLNVTDKLLLDILYSDPQLKHLLLLRLSDTVALADPGQIDSLLARLLKLGYLPKVLPT